MKTLTTIILALTIATAFAGEKKENAETTGMEVTVTADMNEKYFEINKWGYAQYTYWMVTDKRDSKFGPKPISDRTLYLETSKAGIIDTDMSWKEFSAMSVEEWKMMLIENQQSVISAMEHGFVTADEVAAR